MSDWRENNPLSGAERYLWRRLQRYPHYDWREPPRKSPLHTYYEEGWELTHHLQDLLFGSGASFGGLKWPFAICGIRTDISLFCATTCSRLGCNAEAESVVNGRLYCHCHGYKTYFKEDYVPPTEDESRYFQAMWRAMSRMHELHPPQIMDLGGGLEAMSTIMDRPYLEELVRLVNGEERKLAEDARRKVL